MMQVSLRNKPATLFVIALVIFTVVLTVAFFSRLYAESLFWDLFLSSDALYLPSLYQDLVVDGHSLDDWHLNPAPNFFPDMAFYFILRFLCGNFIWSTFLFALLQVLLIQGLLLFIFRRLYPGKTLAFALLVLMSVSFFGFESLFFERDISIAFHPFSNAHHIGAFIVSVFCFLISRRLIEEPDLLYYVLLLLLCVLTTASDRLFLILFPAPFFGTAILLWLKRKPAQVFLYGVVVANGCYLGVQIFNEVDRNTYEILNHRLVGSEAEISAGWKEFCKNIYDIVTPGGFKSFAFCLSFLSVVLLPVLAVKSRKSAPDVFIYSVYVFLFSVLTVFAPIFSGKYTGYDCLRYNIFPVFFGGLNLAVFFAYFSDSPVGKKWQYITPLALVLVSCFLFTRINNDGLNGYFNHYPRYVERLDSLARKENLRHGVANYWIAKKATMFSKTGLKVRSVFDDLSIYDHVSNDRWFFDNIFTFVVLNRFADTSLYRNVIREPRALIDDEELRVFKADSFGYKRDTGYRVISYK